MRFALISNGVVTDVVEGQAPPSWLSCGDQVGPGFVFDGQAFAPPPPVAADPRLWWVYPGPFKDRLGMDALAIYASSHGACKAVAGMLEGRLYIDLKDPKNVNMLNLLIATAQPTADPMFAGSGPMTAAKRDVILNTATIEPERYVKGLA